MITIIHGDDVLSSRNFLNDLKLSFIRFDGASEDISELIQALVGSSMFGGDQNILIENLFSKKTKDLSLIIKLINQTSVNVYVYDLKEVSKANLAKFPKATLEFFKLPQNLFNFLDGILPGSHRALGTFNKALQTTELEILLFMIVRQFRLMLGTISGAEIDEVVRLAPWQRGKIERQARFFGIDKLKDEYQKIYQIDLKSKSGGLSLPLRSTIDIWLSNL